MRTLHLISHTHWDREWYRTFQQFRLRLVHLIDGLLDILDHDKNFKYFMLDGQTIVLDDYLAMRPEREAALRKYIRSGRILIGPWHILPDEFLVSPEAHIRNLLEGDRTCRKFGSKMMVGYIPDPFGHIGQMPQILRGFGIQAAVFRRGLSDEPVELWWESPDGSRVFVSYLRDGYDNAASLPTSDPERFIAEIKRLRGSLTPHLAPRTSHLLLMHGTDHMQPPPGTAGAIQAAKGKLDGDKLIHSTLPAYLKAIQNQLPALDSQLPTVHGELRSPKRHHLLPGVLSTRMWIKQRNRACETLLEKWAEPFSLFAALTTNDQRRKTKERPSSFVIRPSSSVVYRPSSVIHHAWRLLMENHPHDSICGCSIDQVHDEMKIRFDQVEQIGEEITKQSLETLAAAIATNDESRKTNNPSSVPSLRSGQAVRCPSSAIVVFNPTPSARTDYVTAGIIVPMSVSDFEIVDQQGDPIPHQCHGLGARNLINVSLGRDGLAGIIGSLHEGRAGNLAIQDLRFHQEGSTVRIQAVMAENGVPNMDAWARGVEAIKAYLEDSSVTTFHVQARSAEAAQVTFTAADVPGLGWRAYALRAKDIRPAAIHLNPLVKLLLPLAQLPIRQKLASRPRRARRPYQIENEFFVVEAKRDGTLNVQDKRTGTTYTGLNRFMDGGDCGDEYNYAPPPSDQIRTARLKEVFLHSGPVQQALELHLELRAPVELTPDRQSRAKREATLKITSHVILTSGVPRVDIRTIVENSVKDHRLRVHFPFSDSDISRRRDTRSLETSESVVALHDGHFEVVRRSIDLPYFDETWVEQPMPEVPQRAFTDVSDGRRGLMIANRGLPEVEVLRLRDQVSSRNLVSGGHEIALTLLRCVGWLSRDDFSTRRGHAGPFLATPGAQMPGKWTFDYSIIPYTVGRDSIPPYYQAYAFETPLRAVSTNLHDGLLPASGSFVEVSPPEFVISAVKEAEACPEGQGDGHGWIVRGYNITGEDIQVTLKPWRKFRKVARVNLAEKPVGAGVHPLLRATRDGSVTLVVRGHEIATVMFRD